MRDRFLTADFVERSEATGYKSLCLTFDTPKKATGNVI